jgi:hypothetical protein
MLSESKVVSGNRLGMIIVDNAIEYMMKAYGDTKLVGQLLRACPEGGLVGQKLSMTKWTEVKDKRNFALLLDWVLPNVSTTVTAGSVNPYHNSRNALYHQSSPLSVEPEQFGEYLGVAKQLLSDLFVVSLDEKEWKIRVQNVKNAIVKKEAVRLVAFSATDDGLIRIETNIPLKNTEAILLATHSLVRKLGRSPSLEELNKALHYSGHTVDQLDVRVSQLRKSKMIMRGKIALTPKGRTRVLKKYGFI